MKQMIAVLALSLCSVETVSAATCEQSVDTVKLFYVNGMFTDYTKFGANKLQLMSFQKKYLQSDFELHPMVDGSWNSNEDFIKQFAQVAAQKYADSGPVEQKAIKRLIRGTFNVLTDQNTQESKKLLQKIFNDLDAYTIQGDGDFGRAHARTVYRYESVPEKVWQDFKSSSSRGRYFNMSIKGKYNFKSWTPEVGHIS